jgi:hypothetical protein
MGRSECLDSGHSASGSMVVRESTPSPTPSPPNKGPDEAGTSPPIPSSQTTASSPRTNTLPSSAAPVVTFNDQPRFESLPATDLVQSDSASRFSAPSPQHGQSPHRSPQRLSGPAAVGRGLDVCGRTEVDRSVAAGNCEPHFYLPGYLSNSRRGLLYHRENSSEPERGRKQM